MPKCKNCYWAEYEKIGNDVYYYCHYEGSYVEEIIAEDDNIGCDKYDEHNVSNNTAKKP